MLASCQQDETKQTNAAELKIRQAESLYTIGQLKAAEQRALQALDLQPDSIDALTVLTNIYIDTDQPEKALLLSSPNDDASPILEQVLLQMRADLASGSFRRALAHLQEYPKFWSNHPIEAGWIKARAEENQGHFEKAHERFVTNFQQYGDRRSHLGMLRTGIITGKTESMQQQIDLALETNSDDALLLSYQAQLYAFEERWTNAERSLSLALSQSQKTDVLTGERVAILRNLTSVLLQLNRLQEPSIYDQLIAQQRPDFLPEQARIGQVMDLLTERREEEAKIFLQDLLNEFREEMSAIELLAQFYAQRGELTAAARLLSANSE